MPCRTPCVRLHVLCHPRNPLLQAGVARHSHHAIDRATLLRNRSRIAEHVRRKRCAEPCHDRVDLLVRSVARHVGRDRHQRHTTDRQLRPAGRCGCRPKLPPAGLGQFVVTGEAIEARQLRPTRLGAGRRRVGHRQFHRHANGNDTRNKDVPRAVERRHFGVDGAGRLRTLIRIRPMPRHLVDERFDLKSRQWRMPGGVHVVRDQRGPARRCPRGRRRTPRPESRATGPRPSPGSSCRPSSCFARPGTIGSRSASTANSPTGRDTLRS